MIGRRGVCACSFLFLSALVLVGVCFAADKKEPKVEANDAGVSDGQGSANGAAEVRCESDVLYGWKPGPTNFNQYGQPIELSEAEKMPLDQFYKRAFATGRDAESVKKQLASQLGPLMGEARKECELERQSKGECVTRQLNLLGASFQQMDFETRRMIREEIVRDCQRKQGVCLAVRSTEPVCVTSVVESAVAGEPEQASAAAAGKDKKKKK